MKIESQKLSITEAFRGFYYVVPDYQREYVWKERNVSQLLSDIYDEYANDRAQASEYFIGSIVVNKKEDGTYEVIDGQQRLTTLFLGLCAFKSVFEDKPEYLGIIKTLLTESMANDRGDIIQNTHLILQYEDTSDILNKIMEGKEINGRLTGSSENIKNAYDIILGYLRTNFKDEKGLKNFFGYFIKRVNFVQIETPSVSDALKIFETINERGIGLNPMDLLKNLIFRQLERKKFSEVNSDWKKITKLLEKNKQKPLRFLRYFIMANYQVKDTKDAEVVREDEIYDWIIRHEEECDYSNNPFSFVAKLYENAEAYINFLSGIDLDKGENIYLQNIRNLGGGAFSQHLVLLLAAKNLRSELFTHLAKQIEALVFYYFITRTPAKALEVKFSKWADELRTITNGEESQEQKLNDFIKNIFRAEIKQMENNFKLLFLNLSADSLQGYKLKYLIAKIAQYVDSQRLGQSEMGSMDTYLEKGIEIEHILPQNPKQELLDTFENSDQYNDYKIRLGNLTLLEKPINIVAGRNFFVEKKKLYKKSKFYLTKSIAEKDAVGENTSITRIDEKLISFEEWDKKAIEDRQQMLFTLAKEIWKVKPLND